MATHQLVVEMVAYIMSFKLFVGINWKISFGTLVYWGQTSIADILY